MSSNLAPGLARKLRKVLETRTDSPELLASLTTLSSFYAENSLRARRSLRSTIEKRGLSINEEFLRASEAAQKALDAVDQEVSGLAECCDRIAKSLSSCSAATGDVVTATERLKQELETTTQRQELVSNFLHNYQLSPEEVNSLREEDMNENFFKALARVQEIHANCKVLLRTHHQRAGLELMDMMAVYQEGAYERLCRWVQVECRSLGDNDTPEVTDLLKTAAKSLRERPVLFKYCAEEVANTRHNALFRRFISALTRGGPGGMPRPIEVHAHDPLRYVGDMLAWLHQALASERELATALFAAAANGSSDITSHRFAVDSWKLGSKSGRFAKDAEKEEGKVEADVTFVLDRVFEGVCRPFKVRVEQVLQSQPGLIISYKLSNLLGFYSHTISELLGPGAALSVTLRDVKDAAGRTFFDIVRNRGEKLLRYPAMVAVDLSPPPAVADGVTVLLELIDNYTKMMVPAGGKKPDFEPVISAVVDPLIQMCERAAEAYTAKSPLPGMRRYNSGIGDSGRRLPSPLPSPLRSSSGVASLSGADATAPSPPGVNALRRIYLVNCLSAIQRPLVASEVARERVRALAAAIEAHLSALVEEEAGSILERCGLQRKLAYITERSSAAARGEIVLKEQDEEERPMAEVEDMSPEAVSESLKSLLARVAGGGEGGSLPEFEQMQVPRLRSEAANQVARVLVDAYETIFSAVMEPANRYPDPKSMLRHTPDQIRTILGV